MISWLTNVAYINCNQRHYVTGWKLTHILNTHWHGDHTGGNDELKRRHGCVVVGPRAEAAKIPGIDVAVGENDQVQVGRGRGGLVTIITVVPPLS